jgi:hypothetical protein
VESAVALALAVHGVGGAVAYGSTRILFQDKIYMHKVDLIGTGFLLGEVQALTNEEVF